MGIKLPVLVVTANLLLALSVSADRMFGYTLSESQTDPFANTGAPAAGLVTLYLWYYCANNVMGLASAEFDICSDIGTLPMSFTAMNGFLNAGGATNLLLAVGGCPYGPVVAGSLLLYDATGAGIQVYPCPSAMNGLNVSVNCVELLLYENDYIGYASDGSPAPTNCVWFCILNATQSSSWGNVKSLYR